MEHSKQNRDKINRIRKISLYSFILFLAISALLAISSVLSGEFSDFEVKILLSTSIVALASICSLCCSAHIGRKKTILPGMVGIALAILSAVMLLLGIWAEFSAEGFWKTTAVLCVFAVAFAHTLALMAVDLRTSQSWLRFVTAITIFSLAFTIASQIIEGEFYDENLKLMAVLAILAALETLVIPILGRMAKAPTKIVQETLILIKKEDGLYEDRNGQIYQVSKMDQPSPQDPGESETREEEEKGDFT